MLILVHSSLCLDRATFDVAMSSDSDTDAGAAAATVALYNVLYTGNYCAAAASVLFIYDAFATFDREVSCFWTARWTGAPLLFFANKWISMTIYVMAFVVFASFLRISCSVFINVLYAVQILQFVPGAVFSALRAYVLSRSKLLGSLALVLSLAPVGANLVQYRHQLIGENIPPFGCLESDSTTEAVELRFVIFVARVPLIIADLILVCITWMKLSNRGSLRKLRQSKRLSLSDILFRDGTMYFVALCSLNVLHLVFTVTAVAGNGNWSLVSVFTGPITAILISRFLLDLQEANQAVVRVDPDDPLHSSRDPYDTPTFISSLGAFINPDVPAGSDDDLDSHDVSRSDGMEEGGLPVSESQAAGTLSSA
ncbi:hypothetical protein C8T65DRAFT_18165 [Cerioporus squamosus]|nr:hypothetical protein C8T65DRAFT_18165 [Cerioporus squamosus]